MPRLTRGISRRGLVLYLPLYRLDGDSFMDRSAYGHLCTVTGALWTPQGRVLDGNDYISIAANTAFAFAGGDFTIEIIFKPTFNQRMGLWCGATDYWMGIDYNQTAVYPLGFGIWASSNGTGWNLINADAAGNGVGTLTAALNRTHHVAFVRSGNNWLTYVNLVKDVDITVAGSIITRASEAKWAGRWGNGGYYGIGTWGEYRIHNRALSLTELTQNYLAAKRRCPWYR